MGWRILRALATATISALLIALPLTNLTFISATSWSPSRDASTSPLDTTKEAAKPIKQRQSSNPDIPGAGLVQAPAASSPAMPAKAPIPPLAATCVANTLVILTAQNVPELRQAIKVIEQEGGCIVHVFPTQAVIGFVPLDVEQKLTGTNGIAEMYHSPVAGASLSSFGPAVQQAVTIWNQSFSGPQPAGPIQPGTPAPPPLIGDVLMTEPPAGQSLIQSQSGSSPDRYQVSEYLAGKVAVGIILPESAGALDPSTEDWSPDRADAVVEKIQAAMNWWANTNPSGHLSFYYDVHTQVPTRYEPIKHPSTDDHLWVAETLDTLGYPGADSNDQTFDYLNAIRTLYQTDWAVVVYVIDSLNDQDEMFANGYFAYTYGYLIVMTYDNGGWGIGGMDNVMAHEFGHNFGAADKYCSPPYGCCSGGGQFGYLGISNSNCEAGCDGNANGICDGDDYSLGSSCSGCPTCVQTTSLMKQGTLSSGLDSVSRAQVGMRDSDGDGLPDPVDTKPTVSVAPSPPPVIGSNSPTLTGIAQDTPYHSPSRADVTINKITAVEFQLDSTGIWFPASATDGTFDQTVENFDLRAPLLADGNHSLAIRARNRFGNISDQLSVSFTVDTMPPVGSISVNSGAASTSSRSVILSLPASDGASGLDHMMVANDNNFSGSAWQAYSSKLPWTLRDGDGAKTVYVRYRDRAGNVSSVYADSITLNSNQQAGSIFIDNDAFFAAKATVILLLSAPVTGNGPSEMRFSDDRTNWSAWEPYAASRQWVLRGTDGYKTVYGQFRDGVGNLSIYSDTIVLDRTPPDSAVSIPTAPAANAFKVTWSGTDGTSGLANYDLQYRLGKTGAWTTWLSSIETTSAVFSGTAGQTYFFRVRAKDRAGNLEEWPANPDGNAATTTQSYRLYLPRLTN